MYRRCFLMSAIGGSMPALELAAARTFVYKTADGCEIKLDAYNAGFGGKRPCAVWIHGGALIMGSRAIPEGARVLRSLVEAGFVVVSIDYRLAPETKLPQIIEDVQDAFRWIRAHPDELSIDPRRVVACGASAGGYLTLMSGFCVKPRPKALVSFWGYGDIVGEWYSRPDPFYLKEPRVSREEALAAVGRKSVSEPPRQNSRGRFYLYCRQQGTWPKEVAGHDPDTEGRWFDDYCPIRNVTAEYPPALLIHGTADTDVPYRQSVMMADRLKRKGVKHRLETVPGGAHGVGNIAPAEQDRLYREAAAFLAARV